MQEMQVQSLGQEDPLEKGMTTHYIILGQRSLEGYTPWGRRVRHELATCHCSLTKLCLILYNPMDYSLPGSSLHGISQARVLEWVGISFSRGSSWPSDWTQVSCIAGGFFTAEPSGKPPHTLGFRLNITSCDGPFDDLLFSKLAIYLFFHSTYCNLSFFY